MEDATNIANIAWRRLQILQIPQEGCYKYCKYCATGSFANILLCQILFQSGVPNCVTSKQASESFGIIALASVASIVQVLKYQQYSNNTHVTCVPLEILQI